MDKSYADTVRLLLQVTPDVFATTSLAMKGGTAINLFVRDMPMLLVDIDVVYAPWQTPREQALADIARELDAITRRLSKLGVNTRTVPSGDLEETKLLVGSGRSQVKIEVNAVFRGTVLPVERRALVPTTAQMFSVELDVPMLAASPRARAEGPRRCRDGCRVARSIDHSSIER